MIINVETVKQKVEIKISDDPIQFSWSPNYHTLLHESIIEIVSNIQNISPPSTPPSTPSTPGGAASNSISPVRIELLTFDCKHINVDLFLNQNKQIEIKMLNTKYIWSRKNWQADVDSVKFFFDQQIRNDDRPLIDITGQSILYSQGCKSFRAKKFKHLYFGLIGTKFSHFIGGTALDCIICSLVDLHWSVKFGFGLNHIRLQHFYMILHVKCYTLMWSNPKPNVEL